MYSSGAEKSQPEERKIFHLTLYAYASVYLPIEKHRWIDRIGRWCNIVDWTQT